MKKASLHSTIQSDFEDLLDSHMFPVHHVFEGTKNRRKCEKYGFLVCIHPKIHDECHRNTESGPALYYKQECQRYWEQHIGSREEFMEEFGRNYLETH